MSKFAVVYTETNIHLRSNVSLIIPTTLDLDLTDRERQIRELPNLSSQHIAGHRSENIRRLAEQRGAGVIVAEKLPDSRN